MHTIEENTEEFDIKEFFYIIMRYKLMIIGIVVLFTLASVFYAYFKPNIYEATAVVEMGSNKYAPNGADILSMAMETGNTDVATEIRILQSRSLVEDALKNVHMQEEFFITKQYKKRAVYYKDVPFKVGLLQGYDIWFTLYPVDDTHYRLVAENTKTKWHYDALLQYDKEIQTPYFQINILKEGDINQPYYFFFRKKEDLAQKIIRNLTVVQEMQSNVLSISYQDIVPQRARDFVNALAQAYIQQSIERKTREAIQKLAFIDDQMKQITENLRNSAIKIEDFKESANTVSLSAKAKTILEQIGNYETQLTKISMQETMLDTIYKKVKKGKNLETLSLEGLGMEETGLSKLVAQLQESILKQKLLREDYTNLHPTVRRLNKKIAQIKHLLISMIVNLRTNIQNRKSLLTASLNKRQEMLNKLPADERMYGQLERKFVVNEKIYSYLLEKRSETAMMKAATVSKNRIIDLALTPKYPIKPKRKLMVLIGILFGVIVALAVAFLRALMDTTIKTEDDIQKASSVPMLGTIPYVKDLSDSIKIFESPKSALAESFRNIRTNLQFMANEKYHNVIAVTSTIAGEGKTTVSVNLGAILSMSGKKTVILNLDMRKPTLHKKFDLPVGQGLSSLLAERTTLSEVIQKTKYENLDVITSGPVPPNPSELIQGVLMQKILEKLKEVYDVIILDTPPVGLVTDARVLMDYADISIYVFMAGYSKKEFIANLKRISQHKTLNKAGIVLNGIKRENIGYGYGYGYGYYEEDKA